MIKILVRRAKWIYARLRMEMRRKRGTNLDT